eukprot:Opistho-2@56172
MISIVGLHPTDVALLIVGVTVTVVVLVAAVVGRSRWFPMRQKGRDRNFRGSVDVSVEKKDAVLEAHKLMREIRMSGGQFAASGWSLVGLESGVRVWRQTKANLSRILCSAVVEGAPKDVADALFECASRGEWDFGIASGRVVSTVSASGDVISLRTIIGDEKTIVRHWADESDGSRVIAESLLDQDTPVTPPTRGHFSPYLRRRYYVCQPLMAATTSVSALSPGKAPLTGAVTTATPIHSMHGHNRARLRGACAAYRCRGCCSVLESLRS